MTSPDGDQDDPDDLAALLADEAESLQRLIEDAQRLQRQIYDHLHGLQQAADSVTRPPHTPSRKRD